MICKWSTRSVGGSAASNLSRATWSAPVRITQTRARKQVSLSLRLRLNSMSLSACEAGGALVKSAKARRQ